MAKSRALILMLLLLLLFVVGLASANEYGHEHMHIVGAKSEVKDVKRNKEVQELGKFSVQEFNRKQKEEGGVKLRFSQVVEAWVQVVSGIMYYLKIEATENRERGIFNSVVLIKPGVQSKELLNFAPSK